MKQFLVFALLLSIYAASPAQDTLSMDLQQAISYAKSNKVSLKNAKLDIDAAEQTVKSIVATGLPQINANGTFIHNIEIASQQLPDFLSPAIYGVLMAEGLIPDGPIQLGAPQEVQFGAPSTIVGSVSMNQLVFDGTFFLGLKAAKEFVRVSELLRDQTEIELTETVTKAFYGVLIAGENLKQMQASLATVEKTLKEVQEMYDAGYVEKLDVDRLKLSRSTLSTQVANLRSQNDLVTLLFKYTIGMPVTTPMKLKGDIRNVDAAYGMRLSEADPENRVELKILRQQLRLDSLSIDRYKVGYVPSIYLNMNHQRNTFASQAEFKDLGKTWFPGTSYSLSLNIPIFDGFYKKAKISEARIKLEQDLNTLNDVRNGLAFQITQAELNYRIKAKNLETEESNRELAKEIYNTSLVKFKEGVGSSLELTQAEGDKTQAEMRYMNALYDLMIARIDLDKALGKLN
ncbi:MAG: TolC family protein [Flavobacteriales bacterium]|nr:TolC family protein [Flavobacteriales bacterium]